MRIAREARKNRSKNDKARRIQVNEEYIDSCGGGCGRCGILQSLSFECVSVCYAARVIHHVRFVYSR
jgi:hypothetical protein